MTMVRGEFSQLMAPGLHEIFVHWLDLLQRRQEYSELFNIETSSKAYEDEAEFSGFGPMSRKDEGTSVIYTDAVQGGTVRYTHFTYALGVRTSFELYQDDQYNIINQVPKALARSSLFSKETNFAKVFNNGWAAAGAAGTINTTDGVSLFNTQHPLLGGAGATNLAPGISSIIAAAGTFPNRPTVDVDLSITALQLALNSFRRLIDSQGMPIVMRPKYLVIPPELVWMAKEILGSPHKPYTSDNEINAILDEGLMFFVYTYLTSASAWYLLTDKEQHQLKVFIRMALDQDYSDDFDTRSVKQICYERYSYGATSWMGVWGSNGP